MCLAIIWGTRNREIGLEMGTRLCLVGLAAGLFSCGPALAITPPDCAGTVAIARAEIVRVEKNGALTLNDGLSVMLEGIRLPLLDGAPREFVQDALHSLSDLATATPLTLAAKEPQQDRYQRLRAHAFGNDWLQTELLRRGLARVSISPERQECAADLYQAEKEAREKDEGLWAFPAFAVRQATAVPLADAGHFEIVEGRVVNAATRDGRIFLDFSADYRHGFSAIIAPEDA